MGKEYGNLLDLQPIDEEENSGFQGLSLVLPEDDQMKREVIQIGDDNIVFQANVDAASTRSCISINITSEIYQCASEINKEVSSTLTEMIEDTKGSPCGPYVEEFNKYLARMASQNTIKLAKIGTAKIAYELAKPPLPPLIKSKPRPLLAKLLGY
jgi:hypothetical protein